MRKRAAAAINTTFCVVNVDRRIAQQMLEESAGRHLWAFSAVAAPGPAPTPISFLGVKNEDNNECGARALVKSKNITCCAHLRPATSCWVNKAPSPRTLMKWRPQLGSCLEIKNY